MIEHKDVVLGFFGAAAGLAGLILVFLGMVVSSFQGLMPPVPDEVRRRYQSSAGLVLAAFSASVACVVLSASWLIGLREASRLYAAIIATFFAAMGLLVLASVQVVWRLLWKKG